VVGVARRIRALRRADTSSARSAVDGFLSSPRCANPNTRRAGALDHLLHEVDADLAQLSGHHLAEAMERLWGQRSPATWNRNRAAIAAWLSWCQCAPGWPARRCPRRPNAVASPSTSRGH
jgi:hypothetical protein